MESKVNYTLVGIFVILLGAATIYGSLWLSSAHEGIDYSLYQTYFSESISGLSVKAPVKYNGVDVGYVKEIDLVPSNLRQVSLILSIDADTPITESVVATLKPQGITGLTYVALRAKEAQSPKLKRKHKQQYPVIQSEPSLMVRLDQVLRDVTKDIRRVADEVTNMLSDKNQQSFSSALENVDQLTQNLNQNVLPQATLTLDRLNAMLGNLAQVTQQMEDNPSMLVRGRKPLPPGPGE